MTRKQADKMVFRIQNQIDALDYYIAISRLPEVREIMSLKFDSVNRKLIQRVIESLKNDLILSMIAALRDTL